MNTFLLGIAIGFATIAMPGPIAVSLVTVSASQGRGSGLRAALGVAGGDTVLAGASVALVAIGAQITGRAFVAVQLATSIVLILFGLVLVARPVEVQDRAAAVQHPLRTFLAITTLMPSAIGGWVAMLAAMPFASSGVSLALFAAGVVVVSFLWHPALGVASGVIGPRLTPQALTWGARLGGVATATLGIVAGVVAL